MHATLCLGATLRGRSSYSGGGLASLCVDTLIQKKARGEKGLDDLLRLLLARFGSTARVVTPTDLARSASEVAGAGLSSFFALHVASRGVLPVKQCLADSGFDVATEDYAGEAFIVETRMPSAAARTSRHRLIGGP